jgi:hypothetical protein
MNNEKMQELQNKVVESVEEYFENYDWDTAWQKYLEDK